MPRTVELRRHTDNEADALTADGVRAAVEIGRRLAADYHVAVSTGAQRTTQAVACMLAGHGRPVPGLTGEIVAPMGKGDGVLIVADDGFSVSPLT